MRVEVDNIVDEAFMVSAMVEAVRAFKNAMGISLLAYQRQLFHSKVLMRMVVLLIFVVRMAGIT